MNEVNLFLSGALTTAVLAIGLFFLKFWRKTGDRFFAVFSGAFFLMASERVLLLFFKLKNETQPWIYTVRLAAFIVIIVAIVIKNREGAGSRGTVATTKD